MSRAVLIVIAGLLALTIVPVTAATALGSGSLVPVRVSPAAGGPRTTFRLSLRNPSRTSAIRAWPSRETLSVSGPRRAHCVWRDTVALPAAKTGVRLGVTLAPGSLGGSWCAGTYHGEIIETLRSVCGPPFACPLVAIPPRTIARFTFRVTPTS